MIATGTTTFAFAQDPGTPGDCSSPTTCSDCIGAATTASCAWSGVYGCMESCDIVSDTSCYSLQEGANFGDLTADEICNIAENDQADEVLCYTQTDCTSCVDAVLSDGENTCQWFEFEDFSYCGSACGMVGCGKTTCDGLTEVSNLNDDYDDVFPFIINGDDDFDVFSDNGNGDIFNDGGVSNDIACEIKSSSCRNCLGGGDAASLTSTSRSTPSSCAWFPGLGCFGSCLLIADETCFSMKDSDELLSADEVCEVADESQADSELCSVQFDCTSCVGEVLSDGVNTCQWISVDEEGVDSFSYCASGCGMFGCGVTTCRADGGAADGYVDGAAAADAAAVDGAADTSPTAATAGVIESLEPSSRSEDGDGSTTKTETGSPTTTAAAPDESTVAAASFATRNFDNGGGSRIIIIALIAALSLINMSVHV